jgi:alpha-ribazole phosphatase
VVYLIRHTRPQVDAQVCYGRLDVPLAYTSGGEIATVLAALPRVHAIISSPSRRCTLLAGAIGERDQVAVRTDTRLLEINFGTWEGQSWAAVPRVELDAWVEDTWQMCPGAGESLQSLWRRIAAFRAEHVTSRTMSSSAAILIVSHQGPLRVLWAQAHGWTPAQTFKESFAYGISGLRALSSAE